MHNPALVSSFSSIFCELSPIYAYLEMFLHFLTSTRVTINFFLLFRIFRLKFLKISKNINLFDFLQSATTLYVWYFYSASWIWELDRLFFTRLGKTSAIIVEWTLRRNSALVSNFSSIFCDLSPIYVYLEMFSHFVISSSGFDNCWYF